jgi:hypothetical protein
MLHSNVALDSSEWNAISGVGEALCVGDGVTSTVSGPVVSTKNPREAQGPVVPAGLVARTTSTCGPSLRSPAGAPRSTRREWIVPDRSSCVPPEAVLPRWRTG